MDPLANLFTNIRNGYMARLPHVRIPVSKTNKAVLAVLSKQKFVGQVKEDTEKTGRPEYIIELNYRDKKPAIERIRRVSKPGRRVYASVSEIPRPKTGFGTFVLSTPGGILTSEQARAKRMGGEVLCEVIRGGGL